LPESRQIIYYIVIYQMDSNFEKQHPTHGALLGASTAAVLIVTDKATPLNSILIGLALGYGAATYMKKYGHKLPDFE
jgi:ABC-type phosphate transport system permease subunit